MWTCHLRVKLALQAGAAQTPGKGRVAHELVKINCTSLHGGMHAMRRCTIVLEQDCCCRRLHSHLPSSAAFPAMAEQLQWWSTGTRPRCCQRCRCASCWLRVCDAGACETQVTCCTGMFPACWIKVADLFGMRLPACLAETHGCCLQAGAEQQQQQPPDTLKDELDIVDDPVPDSCRPAASQVCWQVESHLCACSLVIVSWWPCRSADRACCCCRVLLPGQARALHS